MKTVLRPYQHEAVSAFMSRGKATVKAHPGAGKTLIACAIIEKLKEREFERFDTMARLPAGAGLGPFLTLVITTTLELKTQWRAVLDEQEIYDVFIITYAKAGRMLDNARFWDMFGLIILDEAHHVAAGVRWSRILIPVFRAKYALGLTSTPPDDPQNPLLRVLPIVYTRTFKEGQAEGYASPVKLQVVKVKLGELERKEYDKLSEEIRAVISKAGSLDRAIAWRGDLFTKRKILVSMAHEKFDKLTEIIKHINRTDDPDRILVWSEYIEALERANMALNKAGIKSRLVHGKIAKKERERTFQEWGRGFQVLLTAKLAEEGVDYPTIEHGILIAGAKTNRQNVQRLGRLLRPRKDKTAKMWLVVALDTTDERIPPLVSQFVAPNL